MPSAPELRFLTPDDFPAVHAGFTRAFSDYVVPMRLTEAQHREMLVRRGIRYELSIAAFRNGEVVGFNLNGLDTWRGVPTVYDLMTGVSPSERGQGLSRQLFDHSLPKLRSVARRHLLEVISTNAPATAVYEKLGFRTARELDCFREVRPVGARSPEGVSVEIEPLPADWSPDETRWDVLPSWQNGTASLRRAAERPLIARATRGGAPVGYGLAFASNGDLAQLWVAPEARRQGIGARLLLALRERCAAPNGLRALNVDSRATDVRAFLERSGFERFITQHEMELPLA